jgi:fido (protein-threonine AMPylation protein)
MSCQWKPIARLSDEDRGIDLSDVDSLKAAWLEVRSKLAHSGESALKSFNERLARQWSIETGIIERTYELDRGITSLLIERGFIPDLVERSSTNLPPDELIDILRDHRAAVDFIQDCVADSRPLTTGFINALHSILTRHQQTVECVDQFGNPVSLKLQRGVFKLLPNNPTRPDGTVHEYCPPIHVSSEMDNLVAWYSEYVNEDVNPVLIAAWLHHRFTQIHPYQDGNGRVARALANLVLIKYQMFPVTVFRDSRSQYIDALEQADAKTLQPFVRLIAEIEKKTILEALSLPVEPSTAALDDVAEAIGLKLKKRKTELAQQLRNVNSIAESLQKSAEDYVRSLAQKVVSRLEGTGLSLGFQVLKGGPAFLHNNKPTGHWYRYQVTRSAQEARHRVNFDENHYFVRTRLSAEDIPWLTFVISFHHIGTELSGVMDITAFAEISYASAETEAVKPDVKSDLIKCMDRPFAITYRDDADAVRDKFLDWVNEAFTVAIRHWADVL